MVPNIEITIAQYIWYYDILLYVFKRPHFVADFRAITIMVINGGFTGCWWDCYRARHHFIAPDKGLADNCHALLHSLRGEFLIHSLCHRIGIKVYQLSPYCVRPP